MIERRGIVVQISTYPGDVRHFRELLPHHIRVWGPSVERLIVTIDTHQARAGRYRAANSQEKLDELRQVVARERARHPALESVDVDYSAERRAEVARYFFNRPSIPAKAWDGGYFHSLLFGLYETQARYIMHFDGDMLFGGLSPTWIAEAMACLERKPDVLVISPFPGPPRPDGQIFGHETADQLRYEREAMPEPAYRHRHLSSRAFFIDMDKFKSRLGAFGWVEPSAVQRLKAKLLGHEPEAIEAEVLMSKGMRSAGAWRLDMLGARPGMWLLHPPYRSEEFYRRLPELINRVESGNVPDAQRGHYDMNDSMIDWSKARAANHWHRRYLRMIRQRLAVLA